MPSKSTHTHYEVEHDDPATRPVNVDLDPRSRWPTFDTVAKALSNAVAQALKLPRRGSRADYTVVKVTTVREVVRRFDHAEAETALSGLLFDDRPTSPAEMLLAAQTADLP